MFKVARQAWSQALSDYYNPPVPEPIIENDETATSFFYIDDETWTVHLNLAGVPHHMTPSEAGPYIRSICHHELQHYLVCPYDNVTSGMMFARARRHVNDATAMFICNLFADLVVDSLLLKRFPALTHDRILSSIHESAIRGRKHSDLWRLVISCYRQMWGFPIPPSVKIDPETRKAAEAIVGIAKKYRDIEQRWPKATEEIAKILKEWHNEDSEQLHGIEEGGYMGDSEPEDEDDGDRSRIIIPLDVDAIMGSPIEIRNGDAIRKCMGQPQNMSDDELERLAMDVEARGGGLEDLQAVFMIHGAGTHGRGWTRFWYRAKVKRLIKIEVTEPRSRGAVPLTPQVWRLGDPIEELDIVQSLQAFPVLIPNLSTRRWMKIKPTGGIESRDPPDLLVVIDSSGSMTWSMTKTKLSGEYHLALVSAFAAIDFALSRGCRVAAINFSVGTRVTEWCRDRRLIEYTLLAYQGEGTLMPVELIDRLCSEARHPVLVLMITDAEVLNWNDMISMTRRLTARGHHLYLFHISTEELHSDAHSSLSKAGATVIPVENVDDLVGLILRDVRGLYRAS